MEAQPLSVQYRTLADLGKIAAQLLASGGSIPVWLFHGEVGAGKTTLIKKVCEYLGVSALVQSPTFSIVNEYSTRAGTPVYHLDCYRLKYVEEAFDIGIEEYLYSGNACFVEWPDKIKALWPESFFEIHIWVDPNGWRTIDAQARKITLDDVV